MNALERVQGVLSELGARGEVADKKTHGVTTESVLQDSRELGIPVWDSRSALVKSVDDLAEDAQRLIDC